MSLSLQGSCFEPFCFFLMPWYLSTVTSRHTLNSLSEEIIHKFFISFIFLFFCETLFIILHERLCRDLFLFIHFEGFLRDSDKKFTSFCFLLNYFLLDFNNTKKSFPSSSTLHDFSKSTMWLKIYKLKKFHSKSIFKIVNASLKKFSVKNQPLKSIKHKNCLFNVLRRTQNQIPNSNILS